MEHRRSRVWRVILFVLEPLPQWGDMWQRITVLLLLTIPPLAAVWQNWPVRNALLFSSVVLAVASFIAAYRLQTQIDDITDGTPNLIIKRLSNEVVPIRRLLGVTGSPAYSEYEITGCPRFYHAVIANEPRGITDRKNAEQIIGHVLIMDRFKNPQGQERVHRWADSPDPLEVDKAADRNLPINIPPNGLEFKFDIALKYDDDESFHTANNETALLGDSCPDWRDPAHKFGRGTYIVRARFSGTNVTRAFFFKVKNRGKNSQLDIKPLRRLTVHMAYPWKIPVS